MKVGIITFHFPHNYGAMIQAYAMQQKLKSFGHDVSIIDYTPDYHTTWYRKGRTFKECFEKSFFVTLRHLVGFILYEPTYSKRYNGFEIFRKSRMNLYPFNCKSVFSEFDVVVLGSDQIWDQPHTNNKFDGPYYGEGFQCKVFSYAASSKHKELDDNQKKEFRQRINKLFSIGVREESFASLLRPLTNKQVSVNLDPTLIVDEKEFSNLNLSRPVKRKYVLVYELNEHKEVLRMARSYAKKINAKVISLVAYYSWKKRFSCLYDQTASPEKFLKKKKNAEFVFTSSFHGTALSLVFEKQFYCIKQNSNSDLRMESLLNQLNLDDHFISLIDYPSYNPINYEEVRRKLHGLRHASEEYLLRSLNSEIPF